MIQKIRTSRITKIVALYLALTLLFEIVAPMKAYALTGGPSQPEFSSFTPIGTSDMVDLSSGDFNYNIPLMDVGGYPINLAYNSSVGMDQEASWVGLGWDLNVGQIARQMRGIPDDFDGDEMVYENHIKDNVTVGANFNLFGTVFGVSENAPPPAAEGESPTDTLIPHPELNYNVGIAAKYNNYSGFTSSVSAGMSFQITQNLGVGMNMDSQEGLSVSPNVSLSQITAGEGNDATSLTESVGVTWNSRRGLESTTLSVSKSRIESWKPKGGYIQPDEVLSNGSGGGYSFAEATFTPSKRTGMESNTVMFNLNVEGEFWGFEPGMKISGYRTAQRLMESEKMKSEKAYGYENSYNATENDILDFNREKDRVFSTYSTTIPVANHTYDLYSIQGQGISGMFRPYKGQVGFVHDNSTTDISSGTTLGVELGIGGGAHFGVDLAISNTASHTKLWRNSNLALSRFERKTSGNRPDYEEVFFKNIGGFHVDSEYDLLANKLGNYNAVMLDIGGGKFSRHTESRFKNKNNETINIDGALKREKRLPRNQAIQRLTRAEAVKFGYNTQISPYAIAGKHDHHTAEIRVINDGGDRYIYGRAAYNIIKRETTFSVGSRQGDCASGLVPYQPHKTNSAANNEGQEQYFNRVTTPAYAHSYLLTSVLSSDYSDLTNNGPTDDDLGSYTKFEYDESKTSGGNVYKWRVPYQKNSANFDEGLKTELGDNKGNYIYGEKELLYLKKIETKTHVAIFTISARKDGYGVDNEDGGGNSSTTSRMYKLDKISLYSKPEYNALGTNAIPIKEVNFVYDYSLCTGVPNNFGEAPSGTENLNQGGKLTLLKVYFTYRDSNMGKYTPYTFEYGSGNLNKPYDIKAYDIWGNYKPNNPGAGCGVNQLVTNAEFPYVNQNKTTADEYARMWLIKSIKLPSGGKIDITFESDDYQYVQNKETMQMFEVTGVCKNKAAGNYSQSEVTSNILYAGNADTDRVFIKVPLGMSQVDFDKKYIRKLKDEEIYFRFLLNMSPQASNAEQYDYVTGYFTIDKSRSSQMVTYGSNTYAGIPVNLERKGDGFNAGEQVNPIAKAGWNFGKQYLNRYVYDRNSDQSTDNVEEIVMNILDAFPDMLDVMKSPNKILSQKNIASRFKTGKSWIRLMCPDGIKYGGGARVKEIKMHDNWQLMTNHASDPEYTQFYGQQYTYTKGVAAYEPLGCKENPFVVPMYDKTDKAKLLGTESRNYIELPLGECFFPAPKITYSKVSVRNLPRLGTDAQGNQIEVGNHATGFVETEFFTSFDYPTLVDITPMKSNYDKSSVLSSILNLSVKDYLTLSQGFTIHTNDMDGRMKSQKVYAEGQTIPISGMSYDYEEASGQGGPNYNPISGKLNNNVITVDQDGKISTKMVGVDYDVINDFRENKSTTTTGGMNTNNVLMPLGLLTFWVPTPLPAYSKHENKIVSASTTKVIHSTGILRGKTVFDAGSRVTTKNLAWDAHTGEVLLTETINEYNDNYYSFNFPAYWAYQGMGQSALNIAMKSKLKRVVGTEGKYQLYTSAYQASDYLTDGDELWITTDTDAFKAYVTDVDGIKFSLISAQGLYIAPEMLDEGEFTVIRSGFRNMQSASMASITSMQNPLYSAGVLLTQLPNNLFDTTAWNQYRIVNTAAIEYSDIWAAQCECRLPKMTFNQQGKLVFDYSNSVINQVKAYNPYVYNIKGNWRAKVSYAYLTGRNSGDNPSPRNTGFYETFTPYYVYNNSSGKWQPNTPANLANWTFASEVSQYNPFGFELENKDALNRYSSALYGYNYTLPVAVAANTRYRELAVDGFEDYDFNVCDTTSHFSFKGQLIQNKVSISNTQSHTGRKSLKVAPNTSTFVKKQVVPCTTTPN